MRNFPLRTRARKFCRVLPSKGRAPHTSTYNTTPKLYTEERENSCKHITLKNLKIHSFINFFQSSVYYLRNVFICVFLFLFNSAVPGTFKSASHTPRLSPAGPSAHLKVDSPIYLLWDRHTPFPQIVQEQHREGCHTMSSIAGLEKTCC